MIVIYGIKQSLNPIKAELSDVIHGCLVTILELPEDKRAHRFIPMEKEDFYYPGGRSDAYTVIEINMMKGRKKETIKSLIHELFRQIENKLNIPPVDIEIIVKEQPAHCWGFRGMTGCEARDLTYKVSI
jgi:phenylpyruvate tautomerase PptA (4-oxalocrotonate tautomerase family)